MRFVCWGRGWVTQRCRLHVNIYDVCDAGGILWWNDKNWQSLLDMYHCHTLEITFHNPSPLLTDQDWSTDIVCQILSKRSTYASTLQISHFNIELAVVFTMGNCIALHWSECTLPTVVYWGFNLFAQAMYCFCWRLHGVTQVNWRTNKVIWLPTMLARHYLVPKIQRTIDKTRMLAPDGIWWASDAERYVHPTRYKLT